MTTEDLQSKYKDSKGELHPPVPLAADAAHLLTDYLDSMAVELVRQGIAEPYRITREYEEIFVQELQKKSTTGKLTYDVTQEMLDNYGTPKEVVDQYMIDEGLKKHSTTRETISKGISWLQEARNSTRFSTIMNYIGKVFMILVFLSSITVLSFGMRYVFTINFQVFPVPVAYIMSLFVIMEIITGLRGLDFDPKYYQIPREISRFLLTSYFITYSIAFLAYDIESKYTRLWWTIAGTWLVVYSVGWIKDHTQLLISFSQNSKPTARYFLPSYIILEFAYIGIFLGFWLWSRQDFPSYLYNTDIRLWLTGLLVLGGVGLLMDYRRKYPLSIKKIGYTFLLGIIPAFYYSNVGGRWRAEVNFDWHSISNFIIFELILYGMIILLLFRVWIKTQIQKLSQQLNKYRLELDDYRT